MSVEDTSKIIYLFLMENRCCDPSLELSQDCSNGGSQYILYEKNVENYP